MNEQISQLLQKKWVIPTAVGFASFAGGVGVGYVIGSKVWQRVVEEAIEVVEESTDAIEALVDDILGADVIVEEIITEEGYSSSGIIIPEEAYPRPDPSEIKVDERLQGRIDEMLEAGYSLEETHSQIHIDIEESLKEEEVETVSVFAEAHDWNYQYEVSKRTTSAPYILHRDEFFENEVDYDQHTLTYYAGDDILVDEDEVPVYNYIQVVGDLRFGHGSLDRNVLYVRNDSKKVEYEILRDSGMYSVEVLGLDNVQEPELKHSVRRFRLDE